MEESDSNAMVLVMGDVGNAPQKWVTQRTESAEARSIAGRRLTQKPLNLGGVVPEAGPIGRYGAVDSRGAAAGGPSTEGIYSRPHQTCIRFNRRRTKWRGRQYIFNSAKL